MPFRHTRSGSLGPRKIGLLCRVFYEQNCMTCFVLEHRVFCGGRCAGCSREMACAGTLNGVLGEWFVRGTRLPQFFLRLRSDNVFM